MLLEDFEKLVIFRAEKMMDNPENAHKYLISLLKSKVCTRLLSFNDLRWCKEVYCYGTLWT